MAILSFQNKEIEEFFWHGKINKRIKWKAQAKVVKRKLDMLHFSKELIDLKSPPSNFLEPLKGDLKGYYSIRINDQWRLIFQWEGQPLNVNIVDYH